jgi:hypothetical protein
MLESVPSDQIAAVGLIGLRLCRVGPDDAPERTAAGRVVTLAG